jgi:hypothetical protein
MTKPKTQTAADTSQLEIRPEHMTERKITLPDGRYLIFYEFSSTSQPVSPSADDKRENV